MYTHISSRRAQRSTLAGFAVTLTALLGITTAALANNPATGTLLLYGQAYDPNIGYINFYCNGSNGTTPAQAGASTLPGFCSNTSYGVTATQNADSTYVLHGNAYSSTSGWLTLDGVTIDASGQLAGTTMLGNFGTTNFGSSNLASGVTFAP